MYDKDPLYNTTIFSQLNSQSFEEFFKTGRKDRYELVCAVDAYNKVHVPVPDNANSGGGRPFTISSYKGELISLGQTINLIDNWIQCF